MSFDPISYAMGRQAGGGGGGVTVEPLSVTENRTYTAPAGKAYSPVRVAVDPDEWQRPADWPDLDSIEIPDEDDCVYLTYDLRKTEGYGFIGIFAITADSSDFSVSRGHLSEKIFVVDENHEVASNTAFRQSLDEEYGDVQLWRIKGTGITRFGFASSTTSSSDLEFDAEQPCVEACGRALGLTTLQSSEAQSQNAYSYSTVWLERFAVKINAANITSCDQSFAGAFALCEVDFGSYDFQNCTTARAMFMSCYKLQKINGKLKFFSALTNANNMFQYAGLSTVDLRSSDFSGVTSFNSMVQGMRNLTTFLVGQNIGSFDSIANNENVETVIPFVSDASKNYSAAMKLTIASLLTIIDYLPEVETTRTLTLGPNNLHKLTAEQIAIATEKGWTVA